MRPDKDIPEFRFYYFTANYTETIAFYREIMRLEAVRSWDNGSLRRGTIFRSPNKTGYIEIEEGTDIPVIQGALYIEVEDVDAWYERLSAAGADIVQPLADTDYGHRSFKFKDPGKLIIGLFRYTAP